MIELVVNNNYEGTLPVELYSGLQDVTSGKIDAYAVRKRLILLASFIGVTLYEATLFGCNGHL